MIEINKFYKFILVSSLSLNLYGLSIDEAVDTALQNSTDLKKVSMNAEIAKSDLKQMLSSNYGSVNLSASYTHYNLARTLTPITPSSLTPTTVTPSTKDMMNVGVSYKVNIFTGFEDTQNVKIALLQKDIVKNLHLLSVE